MSVIAFMGYVGVFVFAITGALVAARKEMDIFGFVVLALMPAVGGGTLRDLILDVPVFWILDTNYLFITLFAAVLTFFGLRLVNQIEKILLWLDAVGLSVFCVVGTAKAMTITGDPVVSVVMGVITAVAGGIARDVIANELPLILHKEVYATAAFVGAVTYVLMLMVEPVFALPVGIAAALATRSLGVVLGLSFPTVRTSED